MPTEGRRLRSNGLSEETSFVLRDGGNDGNKIGEDSGDISDNKETRIHKPVSPRKYLTAETMSRGTGRQEGSRN